MAEEDKREGRRGNGEEARAGGRKRTYKAGTAMGVPGEGESLPVGL